MEWLEKRVRKGLRMQTVIDGITVQHQQEIDHEELKNYVDRGKEKFGDNLQGITVDLDGDYAEISYDVPTVKFDRIRRITGYLVGTLDRFNDAKRAEEADRVKHSVEYSVVQL